MKCGIIMQVTPREITVLTPDGEFIKMNKERKDYQLGEEIPIEVHESKPRRIKGGWKLKILVSGLVATLLVVLSFIPILLSNSKVSAYVSMDVNSSIELGITEELKVIEVKGINLEGKQIIGKLEDWKGQNMEKVISEIVSLNQTAGHFKTNSNLLFSTVLIEKDQQLEQSLQKELSDVEDMIPQVNHSVKIELKKATVKDRKEAKNKGISTGTYLKQTPKKSKTDSSSKVQDQDQDQDKVADSSGEEANDHPDTSDDKVKIIQQTSRNPKPVDVQNSVSKEEYKQKAETTEKETKKADPDKNQGNVKQIPKQEPPKKNDYNHKKNQPSPKNPHSNQKVTNENKIKEQKASGYVREPEKNSQKDDNRIIQQKNQQQKTQQNKPVQKPPKSPNWNNNQQRDKKDIHKQAQKHANPTDKHDGHKR